MQQVFICFLTDGIYSFVNCPFVSTDPPFLNPKGVQWDGSPPAVIRGAWALLPPVGWQGTVEQPARRTSVSARRGTVAPFQSPGHFPSVKEELGLRARLLILCFLFSSGEGWRRSSARGVWSWGGRHHRKGSLPNFLGRCFSFLCQFISVFYVLST